jgi:hypothetical protein
MFYGPLLGLCGFARMVGAVGTEIPWPKMMLPPSSSTMVVVGETWRMLQPPWALALPHPPDPALSVLLGGEALNPFVKKKGMKGHKKLKKISQPIVKIYQSFFLEICP